MRDEKLLVVVATYNEIESLPGLVQELLTRLPQAQLLIIDDNSPDGTGEWVSRRKERDPRLRLLTRPGKLGLGSATLAGLKIARDEGFALVATLDADGSHSPAALTQMVDYLKSPAGAKADVIIGSRYVAGGAIIGWPWYRRCISRNLNRFVRFGLNLQTHDNSSALRVYRTQILERLDLNQIRSKGYAYLEELLYRLQGVGAMIQELPIEFRDRGAGRSKATWHEAWGVVRRTMELRLFG